MKKLFILVVLQIFLISNFSLSNEDNRKNNYVKWVVEFKTLNEENKLKYCYPYFGKIADFALYQYIYAVKTGDSDLKLEKFSKENYVISSYKQHVIFKLFIYDELDSLSNKLLEEMNEYVVEGADKRGDFGAELRETLTKDDELLTASNNFLGTPVNTDITETEIPNLCDKSYNNFVSKNKDKLNSEFQDRLSFLEKYFIKEFYDRKENIEKKM